MRGFGIGDGHDLAFSSDGQWAYLVNQQADPADPHGSIVIFQRDPATGARTQLPGSAGCLNAAGSSQDGPGTCQAVPEVSRPFGISISPDDRHLYVSDFGGVQHIVVLARDATTGALNEVQCLAQAPGLAGCATTGRVLGVDQTLTMTPDGLHAYSSFGYAGGGISIFDRDPATGILTQKADTAGCVSDTGKDDTGAMTCAVGRVLASPYGLRLSPDGRTLYVPSEIDNGLAVFRVSADGSLTQLAGTTGCITVSGKDNLGDATCATGRGLVEPFGAAISPDGRTLYEAADNNRATDGIAAFSLDPSTGAVSQLPGLAGCITVDGSSGSSAGPCATGGPGLEGAYTPGISPDGNTVYLPSFDGQDLVVYRREAGPTCTAASASTAYGVAASVALTCHDADGEALTRSVVSPPAHGTLGAIDSATGTIAYTPARGFSGADSFTFRASDGTNVSPPATITIAVAPPPVRVTPPSRGRSPVILGLTHVSQSHSRWREPGSRAHAPVGTTFTFTVGEAARVTLVFAQQAGGRRVHGRCLAQTGRNRHRPACTRNTVRGSLVLGAHAGTNRLRFSGRLAGGRPLGRGHHTVTIVAAGGRSPRAATLRFTIV